MLVNDLVIVMPAYNEAEGITGFISEIRTHVAPLAGRVSFVVADDQSTDNTVAVIEEMGSGITVIRQPQNRGHGPTAIAAYRAGLALDPDLIVHVDGDGQFEAHDFARLIQAHQTTNADVVHGVRHSRTDPWYRRTLTDAVGALVALAAGRRIPDVNTPLRAYRPAVVAALLDLIPDNAQVPHVHLSLGEAWGRFQVRYLPVKSIPRRGSEATGTMWGKSPARMAATLPPKRLRQFACRALGELFRLSLRPGSPMRRAKGLANAWYLQPTKPTS